MKIAFWNLKNKPLVDEVTELVVEENCHLMAFSETNEEFIESIIESIRHNHGAEYFSQETPGCDRIKLIVKQEINEISLLNQHKYYSLIKISGEEKGLIIGLVHFPSKVSHSLDVIRRASEVLCHQITEEEERYGITDSLLMGDFNVDPFEMPMISFTGMNATNAKDCAGRDVITRQGEQKRLFYNPMWLLYSAYDQKPGTHKYDRFGEDVVIWHFLDQVVIRPSLIEAFNFESLKLIHRTTNHIFVNQNGRPIASDHLPISCEVEMS